MLLDEHRAPCNGVTINYQCFGRADNPPLVLIMGLGAQMVLWHEDFCQRLADTGYYVVRFDNRDAGNSSWLDDAPHPTPWDMAKFKLFKRKLPVAYTLVDMANDTFALMDHLALPRAHIVGASMGGMIAQTMATLTPTRLLSLTSIMSTTGSPALPSAKFEVIWRLLKPLPAKQPQQIEHMLKTFKLLNGQALAFDESRLRDMISLTIERGLNDKGLLRQVGAIFASGDRTQALQKIQLPALIVHGAVDKLVPVQAGEATAQAIPNARLKIFPKMGHTLPSVLWDELITDIHHLAMNATTGVDKSDV